MQIKCERTKKTMTVFAP